jgi:hypothetical protein
MLGLLGSLNLKVTAEAKEYELDKPARGQKVSPSVNEVRINPQGRKPVTITVMPE